MTGFQFTIRGLTSILRAGLPHASRYTLHGLWVGATQACAAQGVGLTSIMAQGTWQSDAVHVYVPRLAPSEAPRILTLCFGSAQGTSSGAYQQALGAVPVHIDSPD